MIDAAKTTVVNRALRVVKSLKNIFNGDYSQLDGVALLGFCTEFVSNVFFVIPQ